MGIEALKKVCETPLAKRDDSVSLFQRKRPKPRRKGDGKSGGKVDIRV